MDVNGDCGESIIQDVLDNQPAEWELLPIDRYTTNCILFPLNKNNSEYKYIESLFYGHFHIKSIQRVQNPYQYGRYLLRKQLLHVNYEETVFHAVHKVDQKTALKFTCDFRRYMRPFEYVEHDKFPRFYDSFNSLVQNIDTFYFDSNELCVFVLNKLSYNLTSQGDYYIKYVVDFL